MAIASLAPSGLVPRFALFIGVMKRCMADGIDWRRRQGTLGSLGLIAGPLWNYLSHTLRRFAALHARFAAGRLPPAGARRAPRPAPRATAPLDHPAPDTNNPAPETAAPDTAAPNNPAPARAGHSAGRCSSSMAWEVPPPTCGNCSTSPRCGRSSRPRRRRGGSCGRCGAGSPPIRCPRRCARRRGRAGRRSRRKRAPHRNRRKPRRPSPPRRLPLRPGARLRRPSHRPPRLPGRRGFGTDDALPLHVHFVLHKKRHCHRE